MSNSPHVERQLLVSFTDDADRAAILAKHGLRELERVGSSNLWLVETPAGIELKTVQGAVAKEPGVRYAEPNLRMRTMPQR